MKTIAVAVYDSATQAFANPVFVPHVNVAIRSFTDEVNNPQGVIYQHPDDYELWQLAEWDSDTGLFPPNGDDKRLLTRGKDVAVRDKK